MTDAPATRWWKRPAAPGPLGPSAVAYGVVLLPAVLGAVFWWAWWLTLFLVSPGLALGIRVSWRGARERGILTRAETPRMLRALLGVSGAVIGVTVAHAFESRFWALSIAGAGLVGEAIERASWYRRDRRHERP